MTEHAKASTDLAVHTLAGQGAKAAARWIAPAIVSAVVTLAAGVVLDGALRTDRAQRESE